MKIKQLTKTIKGAPLEGLNPLPRFRARKPQIEECDKEFPSELKESLGVYMRVLPYLVQDRYSRKRIPLKLKTIVLENEYLKAEFLPEYGGRLYSLFDKVNGRDLVLRNPVIQPGNLAIRNAWLSGGIEWNVGSFGHTFTTCDNVFCAKLTDKDGNDFIRIYEFERLKGIFWQVDFHLPDGAKQLYTHVRMVNIFDEDTTTYWWSNTAVIEDGNTRVLSSDKKVISFVGGHTLKYETLPELKAIPGIDASYPSRSTRAFDYFIQAEDKNSCTWEAAAYSDGLVLYERSTAPLTCKKLFCWGNHFAGKHWQEFLSEPGHGYYAEIQAGVAPSQLHDYKLRGGETLEWTQCFGGMKGDRDTLHGEYESARGYCGSMIDGILSEEAIHALDDKLTELASLPVTESDIIHTGSGFGALEAMRIERYENGKAVPASMCFPAFTMGKEEAPWKYLLENGVLPEEDTRHFTPSYNVSEKWLKLLEESLDKENGRSWYSLMQYGTSVYDGTDLTVYAAASYSDEDNARRTAAAEAAWLESIALAPSYLVYRDLAILEEQRGDLSAAESYYFKALDCNGAYDDFALLSELLTLLLKKKDYKKMWELYESAPENCRRADRIRITIASAAVKLGKADYLEEFFAEEHYDIKEGENPLTDIWFDFCAQKLAAERGLDPSDEAVIASLIPEAVKLFPPAYEIDFRMSTDTDIQYRVSE